MRFAKSKQKQKCSVSLFTLIDLTLISHNTAVHKPPIYCSQVDDTIHLNQMAQSLLKSIYRPNTKYKKAGVMLSGIESIYANKQPELWVADDQFQRQQIMQTWDQINNRFGKYSIKLGSELLSKDWYMSQDMLSQCYTTKFDELPTCRYTNQLIIDNDQNQFLQ